MTITTLWYMYENSKPTRFEHRGNYQETFREFKHFCKVRKLKGVVILQHTTITI